MLKSYSADLRRRVIEAVETGASRREAAESFGIDASSAVERDRALRAETAGRKRFSAGTAWGTDIGSRCRTIGPDLGGDPCGTAQAADSNQQERGLAVFRATRHHLQKKESAGSRTASRRRGPGAPALDPRARHA